MTSRLIYRLVSKLVPCRLDLKTLLAVGPQEFPFFFVLGADDQHGVSS
jgi:hypothetical protein